MQKEEIEAIIAKYQNLAGTTDDEKAAQYERFAGYIEENITIFEDDDYYETEEDLLDDFNAAVAEIDAQWEAMFPEGDEDDSITDFLTR
ncbi:MAG: hypothetical protein LBU83_01960 [Bacteroidales bacterium]|jgi:hypothetical protein|nr:hypothetical protein [Bacteroidales bacterium]